MQRAGGSCEPHRAGGWGEGLGFRGVSRLRIRVYSIGFIKFRVQGLGLRIIGLRFHRV